MRPAATPIGKSACAASKAAIAAHQRQRVIRSLAILLCSIGLVAPVAKAGRPVGGAAPFDLPLQHEFPRATYYRVTRPDPRLCPSPLCGGVFVERVNRSKSKCADGKRAKECYVGIVDISTFDLSLEEEEQLRADFFAKRVLVRGDLELAEFGVGDGIPTLFVADAWRAVTGTQADRGRYFGVVSSGIVCISFPCPSFAAWKLNGRRVRWLHSIDLESSGATSEEIDLGLAELFSGPGLIGFGQLRRIKGPAGKGKELQTSEFYTKVEERGARACGGFTFPPNPVCAEGDYCEQPAGSCFIADLPGTCQLIPEACIEIYDPVCGCDGVTYANDCHRQQAQMALDHVGACPRFQPNACDGNTCISGTTCCDPSLGTCASSGLVCVQH